MKRQVFISIGWSEAGHVEILCAHVCEMPMPLLALTTEGEKYGITDVTISLFAARGRERNVDPIDMAHVAMEYMDDGFVSYGNCSIKLKITSGFNNNNNNNIKKSVRSLKTDILFETPN